MWLSRYVCLFFIYSVLGWLYECTYCTIRTKKWENRGFLFGPICPIYGCGAVAISLIAGSLPDIPREPDVSGVLRIFIISVLGSMILEYSTSWILEKLFHATWWDYSDLPFNLHGRISLFTTCGFGVAGPLVVYLVIPPFEAMIGSLPPIAAELLSLVAVALAAADMTLTVTALTDFERRVMSMEDSFNDRMDAFVEDVQASMNRAHQSAVRRVRAFRYPRINRGSLLEIGEAIKKLF